MRIRGAKSELEEAGEDTEGMVETTSELRDLIKGMTGFDIMADEAGTQFKSIYDIVLGIGKEWNKLTDIEQASLLEKLAGKRQGNALSAVLNNIDTLQAAYQTAETSAGSAMRENARYQESIQYSLDRFKASFQELSTDFIGSDFLKGVVDGGNLAINVLDKLIDVAGMTGTVLLGLGGYKLFSGGKPKGFLNEITQHKFIQECATSPFSREVYESAA